jgi:glycosyltransferase involved in cell wall biosynthesis
MVGSGYGSVVRELASHLSTKHTVFCYAEGYLGTLMKLGNYYVTPSQYAVAGGYARPSVYRAVSTIIKYRPHAIIIVGDLLILGWLKRWREKHSEIPIISYFPIDGIPMRVGEIPIAKAFDYTIVPSRFSQEQAKNEDINADYIPHGVNIDTFKPQDMNTSRDYWNIIKDKFVFQYVSNNTQRKKVPRMLEAYAKYWKEDKNTALWLHCIKHDSTGWFVPQLLNYYGINNACFTPYLDDLSVSPDELSSIYNCSDLQITGSSGEGFGLPTVEAMACGKPIVAPNYAAIPEVAKGCGLFADIWDYEIDGFTSNRALVNPDDMAEKMKKLHDSDALRRRLGKKGIERVKKYYSWEVTKPLWLNYMDKVEEEWYKRKVKEQIAKDSKVKEQKDTDISNDIKEVLDYVQEKEQPK